MNKVLIYDSVAKSEPKEVNKRYAELLMKGNPERWLIAKPKKEVTKTSELEVESTVAQEPQKKNRRRRKTN